MQLKKICKNIIFASISMISYSGKFTQLTFAEENNIAKNENKASIVLLGDITLAHRFNEEVQKQGFQNLNPFKNVNNIFKDKIVIANLEGPLTTSSDKMIKTFTFKGLPKYAQILSDANIRFLTLANNHTYDFGKKGVKETRDTLTKYSLFYTGSGETIEKARIPIITEQNGIKIGILSYDDIAQKFHANYEKDGTNPATKENIINDVTSLKKLVDVIVVSFHFGEENTYHPTQRQKKLSRSAIDAGANIVAGTHPHVLQGVEEYSGGLIFYSLGNFCFGGNINPKDKDTMIPIIQAAKDGKLSFTIIPASISSSHFINNFTPTPQTGFHGKRILQKFKNKEFGIK